MKISIEDIQPVLSKQAKSEIYTFSVAYWRVTGKYIMDEKACWCGAIEYKVDLPINHLHFKKIDLENLIKLKINEQNRDFKRTN